MKKKRGRRPLGPAKRQHLTVTLSPRCHQAATAHKSPGAYLELCWTLARCITAEQLEWLNTGGKPADQRLHRAIEDSRMRYTGTDDK